MAFRKLVGSYKDYNLSTHIIEDGYLAVDVDTGSLRIGDGVTAGGTEVGGGDNECVVWVIPCFPIAIPGTAAVRTIKCSCCFS